MALAVNGSTHLIPAYYSFIDPERTKGWVGLVGWPVADGLPTLVVTRQLQVERRTRKVRQSETDVLPTSIPQGASIIMHDIYGVPLQCSLEAYVLRTGAGAAITSQLIPGWTLTDHSRVTSQQAYLLAGAVSTGTTVGYACVHVNGQRNERQVTYDRHWYLHLSCISVFYLVYSFNVSNTAWDKNRAVEYCKLSPKKLFYWENYKCLEFFASCRWLFIII